MNTTLRHRLPVLFLIALMPLMIVLGGCSKAIPPSFEAVSVKEIERSDERSVIAFTIRATNPNADPIPLRAVRYRVSIDGDTVFEGVRSPETTLHKYADSEFSLPAVIPMSYLQGSIDYELLGSVEYIPPGRLSEVLFDAEIKVPEAPLEISGNINTGN
jgi:LEA14-like dessication related protein